MRSARMSVDDIAGVLGVGASSVKRALRDAVPPQPAEMPRPPAARAEDEVGLVSRAKS